MDDRTRFDGATPCPLGEEAVAFALHALEPGEEAAMRSHVERCGSCSETARETEVVAAAVGAAVEQVEPPARLRTNLLAVAAETPQAGSPAPPQPHPRFAARGRRPARARVLIAAAAAAALVAIGGLGAHTVQVQRERDALAAQARALAGIVTQLDAPGSTHAVLSTVAGQPVAAVLVTPGDTAVVTAGLGPNDTGSSTYVVWGLGAGDPHPLAPFDVTESGPHIHDIGARDRPTFTAYAVSLEPGRAMPAVPTAVVATGPVQA